MVNYETAKGWVRVSPYYTAGCHDGRSAFVQSGPADCTVRNGIKGGEFAEWVKAGFLKEDKAAGGSDPRDECSAGRCAASGSAQFRASD